MIPCVSQFCFLLVRHEAVITRSSQAGYLTIITCLTFPWASFACYRLLGEIKSHCREIVHHSKKTTIKKCGLLNIHVNFYSKKIKIRQT